MSSKSKRNFLPFFKEYKWLYINGIVFLFLSNLLQLVFPTLIGNFTNIINNQALTLEIIIQYAVFSFIIALLVYFFSYKWRMGISGTATRLGYYGKKIIFEHMQFLSHDKNIYLHVGDVIAYMNNDVDVLQKSLLNSTKAIIDFIVFGLVTFTIMCFQIGFSLALLSLIPSMVIILLIIIFYHRIQLHFNNVLKKYSLMSNEAEKSITDIKSIKNDNAESTVINSFNADNLDNAQSNIKLSRILAIYDASIVLTLGIGIVLSIIVGGYQVMNGTINIGQLITFSSYLTLMIKPLSELGILMNDFMLGNVSVKRINAFLNEDNIDYYQLDKVFDIDNTIQDKDINWPYLSIYKGDQICILGANNSGKTFLSLNLIYNNHIPEKHIFYNNQDVAHWSSKKRGAIITLVPEHDQFFEKTIMENLRCNQDLSDAYIKITCEQLGITKFINELEYGFDTYMTNDAISYPASFRKKLAIVRALLKEECDIIILDSPYKRFNRDDAKKFIQCYQCYYPEKTIIHLTQNEVFTELYNTTYHMVSNKIYPLKIASVPIKKEAIILKGERG